MLNFPVAGGTSGHLMGSVLTAVLVGPAAAVVVMTAVLIVQCFLFADGGVLALGANVLNMAIVGPVAGYAVYRTVRGFAPGDRGALLAVAFASWCSLVLAATSCAGMLAWSGAAPWSAAFPAMANVHMIIGLGEGLITTLVIAALRRTRPELLENGGAVPAPRRMRDGIVFGLLVAAALAVFVAPFASPWPDGLERVAARLGFEERAAAEPLIPAPWTDYRFGGIGSAPLATAAAGLVGTLVVFGLALLLARALAPRPARGASVWPER
jgi:cobalt/nickel transport system permease protein